MAKNNKQAVNDNEYEMIKTENKIPRTSILDTEYFYLIIKKTEKVLNSQTKKTDYLEEIYKFKCSRKDKERIQEYKWYLTKNKRNQVFPIMIFEGKTIMLGRYILELEPNTNCRVQFKNGDKFDYTRENLEVKDLKTK